jgi:hypothetical protein
MDDQTGDKESGTITRFPSLPKGYRVSELAKAAWQKPSFSATEADGITTFAFGVPLRDTLRSLDKNVYRSLFESGGPPWTAALETAYSSAHSGEKTAAEYIDTVLYTVFLEALKILIKDAKSLSTKYKEPYRTEFEQSIEADVTDFTEKSPRESGRRRNKRKDDETAIRLSERYKHLKPLVDNLRKLINKLRHDGIGDENMLHAELASAMTEYDWIRHVTSGMAFEELPPKAGYTAPVRSSLGKEWASWQLTVGIIRCEEAETTDRRHKPGVITIYRRIMRGRKLLKQSSADLG